MLNCLDLAKAYVQDNKPPKAIDVLQKLVKLPLRTADDAALREEGKKMLTDLQ
jgi:FimV-like protein